MLSRARGVDSFSTSSLPGKISLGAREGGLEEPGAFPIAAAATGTCSWGGGVVIPCAVATLTMSFDWSLASRIGQFFPREPMTSTCFRSEP